MTKATLPTRCQGTGCRAKRWGDSLFCMRHTMEHIAPSLTPARWRRVEKTIRDTVRSLSPLERDVLTYRFGLDGEEPHTLSLLAAVLGMSPSQARRAVNSALEQTASKLAESERAVLSVANTDAASKKLSSAVSLCNDELVRYFAKHPDRMRSAAPDVFEKLIAEVLASFGLSVRMTKKSWDDGVDIFAIEQGRIGGVTTKYIVQCKRFAPHRPVDVEIVRSLWAVRSLERADHAILATTSYFSTGALRFSARPDVWNLHLRDYQAVCDWLNAGRKRDSGGVLL